MKILNLSRGRGKTQKIIELASNSTENICIITHNSMAKKYIQQRLNDSKKNRDGLYLMSINEYMENGYKLPKNTKLIFDEFNMSLQMIFKHDIMLLTGTNEITNDVVNFFG